MSRMPSLSSPFLLGFDEIERVLDRVTKAADGYPPYNIERIARDSKRNYLLLYRDQLDLVEGFLDTRKFLLDPAHSVDNARIPASYVPANSPLNRLLVQFQQGHRRIAVVVDEYGGTAGVIAGLAAARNGASAVGMGSASSSSFVTKRPSRGVQSSIAR